MKPCKACGSHKPLEDFYGNDTSCKECRKKKVRAYRAANIEKVREYDRNRPNHKERVQRNKENYRKRTSTQEGRKREWEKKRAYINSTKRAANIILGNAVRDGKVVRPETCGKCGIRCTPDGHHEDYGKPLDVVWLCRACHGKRHKEINEERRE